MSTVARRLLLTSQARLRNITPDECCSGFTLWSGGFKGPQQSLQGKTFTEEKPLMATKKKAAKKKKH